ncbi:tetraacyldisaccharide 4'-kinase [Hoylesella marshii]|uniref:tetraacyldisaccharide 4'-kinase n=1 Tax=Hoylesella marshii TaxID=189722 RepID=UPI0028D89E49|nr:tetraacyldisaccharide 4'-kinase [Hoylesella marshii]
MEGDFIKINEWLRPISWLYGLGVRFRNQLFEWGVLKSRSFDVPVIAVGNITVGGTGKTPHVEYLVKLLKKEAQVAVLSRGYKRKSRGYLLADADTRMQDIGDEPYQMHKKFENVYVAVDRNRCAGIEHLITDEATKDTDVVLLDDAFQHRYVKPGLNILLVDYHRLIIYDRLLPAGQLREPKEGKLRADIVIVTKCPASLKPMEFRVLMKTLELYAYQDLYFTTLTYGRMKTLFGNEEKALEDLGKKTHVLLLTGIASPKQLTIDLEPHCGDIVQMAFPDHHRFTKRDVERINERFAAMPSPKIIITTEKDATRLSGLDGWSEEAKEALFVLPVEIKFMLEQEKKFNHKIISYVRKNSRNSILAKRTDDHSPHHSHHFRNGAGTISFRNH